MHILAYYFYIVQQVVTNRRNFVQLAQFDDNHDI